MSAMTYLNIHGNTQVQSTQTGMKHPFDRAAQAYKIYFYNHQYQLHNNYFFCYQEEGRVLKC